MPSNSIIRPRGDTAANWTAANPILLSKEIGLETDTRKWKVGDGTTAWNSLAYYNSVPAGVSTFNTRTGDITLSSGDVTTALTFTPAQATHTHAYTDITSVSTGTLFYRKTAGTGAAETQTLATLKTDLGLTGTNSGDQTIILTGDVTGSGTGSFVATIATGAVTFAKMQSSTAASVFIGRGSASGAGAFQEITLGTGLAMSGTSVTVSATVKRTVFSASGTWTKDSRAVLVRVTVYGGGGSGGSGACVASGVGGSGGGGGGGASLSQAMFDAAALGSTETVTVGAGGASVAGVSATGAGTNGNIGGDSSFGAWLTGYGGGRGGAGQSAAVSGGGGGAGTRGAGGNASGATAGTGGTLTGGNAVAGAAGSSPVINFCGAGGGGCQNASIGSPGAAAPNGGGGGGSGGGISASNFGVVGGAGGAVGGNAVSGAAGGAGGSPPTAGTSGGTSVSHRAGCGGGGGGGGGTSGTPANGAAGGAGQTPGGGGGGGGACIAGQTSGAGGAGGAGLIVVEEFF
jgi:hypothetical protein